MEDRVQKVRKIFAHVTLRVFNYVLLDFRRLSAVLEVASINYASPEINFLTSVSFRINTFEPSQKHFVHPICEHASKTIVQVGLRFAFELEIAAVLTIACLQYSKSFLLAITNERQLRGRRHTIGSFWKLRMMLAFCKMETSIWSMCRKAIDMKLNTM